VTTLQVRADRYRRGSRQCWATATDFFDVDDERIAIPFLNTDEEPQRGVITNAGRTCPTGAIQLEDE
jgi:ferredoxin